MAKLEWKKCEKNDVLFPNQKRWFARETRGQSYEIIKLKGKREYDLIIMPYKYHNVSITLWGAKRQANKIMEEYNARH
jgi:hypothetical protein